MASCLRIFHVSFSCFHPVLDPRGRLGGLGGGTRGRLGGLEVGLEVDWEASKVGLEVDWEASEVGVLVRNLTTMRVNIGSMNTFIRQMVEGQTEQTTIAETTS